MIRRIFRSLPWLGAVAALLFFALPVAADDIEPEPYVEEDVEEPEPEPEPVAEVEPEEEEVETANNIEKFLDLAIVRPLYFTRFVVGLPFFVFYPFTISSGYASDVVTFLWEEPFEATFKRPLGESPEEY
jgi:hypothetical protein